MFRRLLLAAATVLTVACSGSPSSSLPSAEYSQVDVRTGTGAEAVNGRTLLVHYTLWLYDPGGAEQKGRQLETSIGRQPFTFTLGVREVIPGWDRGVAGMKAGGVRRLIVPPALAYGSGGRDSVPPNATLVFDIELLSVE